MTTRELLMQQLEALTRADAALEQVAMSIHHGTIRDEVRTACIVERDRLRAVLADVWTALEKAP